MPDDVPLLLILAGFVCFGTYWVIGAARDQVGLTGSVLKTASTGLLAVVAFTHPTSISPLIGLGLAFGALGDFTLTRRRKTAFLLGMAAFAAGHLAYSAAFWLRAQTLTDTLPPAALSGLSLAALIALALLVLSTEIWLAPRTGSPHWPPALAGARLCHCDRSDGPDIRSAGAASRNRRGDIFANRGCPVHPVRPAAGTTAVRGPHRKDDAKAVDCTLARLLVRANAYLARVWSLLAAFRRLNPYPPFSRPDKSLR